MAKTRTPAMLLCLATSLMLSGISLGADNPSVAPTVPAEATIPLTKLLDQSLDANRRAALPERRAILLRLEQITQSRLKLLDDELREISLKLYLDGTGMPGRLNAKELELSELIRRQLDFQAQAAAAQAELKSQSDMIQQGLPSAKVEEYLARDPLVATKHQQIDQIEMEIASVPVSDSARIAALQKRRDALVRKLDDHESEVRVQATQMILQDLTQSAKHSMTELDALTKRIDSLKHDLGAIATTLNHYAAMKSQEKSLQSRLDQIHEELDVIAAVLGSSDPQSPATQSAD